MKLHQRPPPLGSGVHHSVRVIVVVEGPNDVEFLRRISSMLHAHDADLPNLSALEERERLLFLPLGGSSAAWAVRLAPLQLPEFHLLDRELPPETEVRQAIVNRINRRRGCRAVLTGKRTIENYLHPAALRRAGELQLEFGDLDSVPEIVAKASFAREQLSAAWDALPRRAHKRLINRVKRWLNTKVVEEMTFELLHERDPGGEVVSWLRGIHRLAGAFTDDSR
ncbi:MAG: ATP-dependent endonuclease [Pirellulaceae bacterium]